MTLERHPSDESLLRHAGGRSALVHRLSSPRISSLAPLAARELQNSNDLAARSLRTPCGRRCEPMRSGERWKNWIRRRPPLLWGSSRGRPVGRISEWRFRRRCAIAE